MRRILPSEMTSKEIEKLIDDLSVGGDNQEILGKLWELGMRKVIHELLEQEIVEYLGRRHYERRKGGQHKGYPNGHMNCSRRKEKSVKLSSTEPDPTRAQQSAPVWT